MIIRGVLKISSTGVPSSVLVPALTAFIKSNGMIGWPETLKNVTKNSTANHRE
jgi:hypothetical protein